MWQINRLRPYCLIKNTNKKLKTLLLPRDILVALSYIYHNDRTE